MSRKKPNALSYALNITVLTVAVASAATTVFLATRHAEMAARIHALQLAQSPKTERHLSEKPTASAASTASFSRDDGVQIFLGGFQPSDMQQGIVQFWIPAAGFKVSSDAFSAEEIIRCEQGYRESVQTLQTEILRFSSGWNVTEINGCWAPESCRTSECAICEPGKIYTVVLDTRQKVTALAQKLASPQKGLIQRLFCQDATLLITRYAGGND